MDSSNQPRSERVHPEGTNHVPKSFSASCTSLPASKAERNKLAQRKIHNMGIIRRTATNLNTDKPVLEYAQLVPHGELNNIRRDRNGEQIDKKAKKHKVTFRDNIIGGQVADIVEVPSYKKYNFSIDDNVDECKCKLL